MWTVWIEACHLIFTVLCRQALSLSLSLSLSLCVCVCVNKDKRILILNIQKILSPNFLPKDRILHPGKVKPFADDKQNVAEMIELVFNPLPDMAILGSSNSAAK